MTKRKRRSNLQSNLLNKVGVALLVIILLVGCYFYLKQENKLPSELENAQVEKLWDKTVAKTDQLKDDLLDKVEEGLDAAKTKINESRNSQPSPQSPSSQSHSKQSPSRQSSKDNVKKTEKSPDTTSKSGSLNLKLEIPTATRPHDEVILKRMAYTASYNNKMKNPNWVAWELTRKETTGVQERSNKFVPDPDLKEPRAKSSDYTHTGYDRGHMAPAADMKWSRHAMEESFYMSNVCPQNQKLNRGDWNDLEDACRGWAKKYGTVYIACGPIYDHPNPKRIGTNKIAVPDRFFKVVLIYNRKDPMALGFVFPNLAHSQDLDKYQMTVDDIEHLTGYDFFSKLPDHIEDYIEAEIHPLPSTRK